MDERGGAGDGAAARAVRQQVGGDREVPAGPHRQRDQEPLERHPPPAGQREKAQAPRRSLHHPPRLPAIPLQHHHHY